MIGGCRGEGRGGREGRGEALNRGIKLLSPYGNRTVKRVLCGWTINAQRTDPRQRNRSRVTKQLPSPLSPVRTWDNLDRSSVLLHLLAPLCGVVEVSLKCIPFADRQPLFLSRCLQNPRRTHVHQAPVDGLLGYVRSPGRYAAPTIRICETSKFSKTKLCYVLLLCPPLESCEAINNSLY